MNWWQKTLASLRAPFRKEKLDAEMDEEMRSHIEMQTRENLASGMSPASARRQAFREFGWLESIQETCRDQRGVTWLEKLAQDARFGLRTMLKHPGSTTLAVVILALGIGGNTAVFSVVEKTILNPIPGTASERLVALQEVEIRHNARWNVSPPLFSELTAWTNVFQSVQAYSQGPTTLTLERNGTEVKLTGVTASPGFLSLFGIPPLSGRTFLPQEGTHGQDNVLVASYGLWKDYFGGEPHFVGSTIRLSGRAYTVIGVMPPSFQFPFSAQEDQFYLPYTFTVEETTNPEMIGNRVWGLIGRVRPGASLQQTRALLDTLALRRGQEHPDPQATWAIEARPARTMFVAPTLAPTLWSLQAAVGMLLLISCANVGTLLVARSVARRGEFSIRLAIGAGRWRLARQLITESLLLAGLAGLLGVFFAWGGIRALDQFYLGALPRMRAVGLDWRMLMLMVLISGLTGLIFGVAPAWIGSHLNLTDALKDTAQQQSGGFGQRLFQDGLVVLQLMLATVLLVGAGLMIQTVVKLLRVNPGLDPKGLYQVLYDSNPIRDLVKPDAEALKRGGTARREAILDWFSKEVQTELLWDETLVEKLRTTVGIEAVAISPLGVGMRSQDDFHVDGRAEVVQGSHIPIGIRSGDYFHTLHLPLTAGRLLTKEDCIPGLQSVVINQAFAQQCWPGKDPLNRRIASKDFKRNYVVVGVVKNTLDWRRDTPQLPAVYEPIERILMGFSRGAFMVRSQLSPQAFRNAVKDLGQQMEPPVKLEFLTSIEKELDSSTASRRVYMWLLTAMGSLGLLLSALGIYAVLAYAVVRCTREIGIRMAVGASRYHIGRLVLGRGGRLIINGLVLGAAVAFTLARYVESLLYQVTPNDPWVFGVVILTLGASAGLACYLPARRAMKINPMTALRYE